MEPVAAIARTAATALAAATSQIESYFKAGAGWRREFVVPSLAFLLGCLALAMSVLGPDMPQAWWDQLSVSLKLLVTALLAVLLGLTAEVSRLLLLIVRRLYSGEWPEYPWLWRTLAERYIHERARLDQRITLMSTVYSSLNATKNTLAELNWRRPARSVRGLVPRAAIPPYQALSPELFAVQILQPGTAGVLSAGDVVGRYSIAALAAGEVVPPGHLIRLPDARYLDASRLLLPVTVQTMDLPPFVRPGVVVTVLLRRPYAGWSFPTPSSVVQAFADVLVVDRRAATAGAEPDEVILSLPAADGQRFVAGRPDSTVVFALDLAASPGGTTAVASPPRLAVTREIRPGWLLGPDEVTMAAGWPRDEQEIRRALGTVYWPGAVSSGAGTDLPPPLLVTERLGSGAARPVADPYWLEHDAAGNPTRREAFRIPRPGTPGGATVVGPPAGPGPAAPPTIEIVPGDLLAIDLDGDRVDEQAYVLEVAADAYYVAVAQPDVLRTRLTTGVTRIELRPFREVWVPGVPLVPGQVIAAGHLIALAYRASDRALIGACLSSDELVGRYVLRDAGDLRAEQPVQRSAVQAVMPATWRALHLAGTAHDPLAARLTARYEGKPGNVGLDELRRGDVVRLDFRATVTAPTGASATEGVVLDVRRAAAGGGAGPSEVMIGVPPDAYGEAQRLWDSRATATAVITHADLLFKEESEAIGAELAPLEPAERIAAALTSADPEARFDEVSERLQRLATRVVALYRGLVERRPWSGDPPTPDYAWAAAVQQCIALLSRCEGAMQRWFDGAERLSDEQRRQDRLALPHTVAEVRPTRLGNVLAAAAEYPEHAYAIDTTSLLPRLVESLGPEDPSVKRLVNAEATLNALLLFSFWSALWTLIGVVVLLMFGGAPWMFLAVVTLGPLLWWVTKEAATTQAFDYGDALKSLFDLKRRQIFIDLGLQLEKDAMTVEEEQGIWKLLFQLFAYGKTEQALPALRYRPAKSAAPPAASDGSPKASVGDDSKAGSDAASGGA